MDISEHILKVTGSASIPEPLEFGRSYAVGCEFEITNEDKRHNEDGTYDIIYKARLVRAEIKTDFGKLKTKDKRSQSTKTRGMILAVKDEFKPEMSDDDFYDIVQAGIRHNLRDIIHNIIKGA